MPMPPILVADPFPEVSRRLVELLRSMTDGEWQLPTVSSRRTVKDIEGSCFGPWLAVTTAKKQLVSHLLRYAGERLHQEGQQRIVGEMRVSECHPNGMLLQSEVAVRRLPHLLQYCMASP